MVLELQRCYPRARISRREVPTVEHFRRLYPWLFEKTRDAVAGLTDDRALQAISVRRE